MIVGIMYDDSYPKYGLPPKQPYGTVRKIQRRGIWAGRHLPHSKCPGTHPVHLLSVQ